MTPTSSDDMSRWVSGPAQGRRFLRAIRQRLLALFALDERQARFSVRGFPSCDPAIRRRLEGVGEVFIGGFNCALLQTDAAEMQKHVLTVDRDRRGFAVEGAAMGAAIADALNLGGGRLDAWMASSEREYSYLAHVGAGWALARAPWRRKAILVNRDPIHHWLIYDGMGFHDAYFLTNRDSRGWRRVTRGYAARVYDQGVGRALWFMSGGDPVRAAGLISAFVEERRADLWSGLGLALAYAGGASETALANVVAAAGPLRWHLAQGAAFAAEAHLRARHLPLHTVHAVRVLTERDAADVARLVGDIRAGLPEIETCEVPRYEIWRRRTARTLAGN